MVPRLLIVTGAVQFIVFAIRPFLSYQALAVEASVVELGLITASFSALSLIAALPMGRAVDRWGERPFVLVGAGSLCLLSVAVAFAGSVPALMVAGAVLGLGHLCASVGTQTLIARGAISARRERRFSVYTLVNSFSQLAAPAICGLLVGGALATAGSGAVPNSARVYAVSAFVGAIGAAAALSLMMRPGNLAHRPVSYAPPSSASMREVMRTPSVPVALLASFSTLSAIDLLFAYLPAYGVSREIPVRTIGFLLAAHGIASMAARVAMPRLIARFGRRRLLAVSMAVPAAALAAIPLTGSVPVLAALMVVSGMGLGLCQPITLEWVAGQVRREVRGAAMSLRLAGNRLGQLVVPIAVGVVAGGTGLAAAFVGPATLLIGAQCWSWERLQPMGRPKTCQMLKHLTLAMMSNTCFDVVSVVTGA